MSGEMVNIRLSSGATRVMEAIYEESGLFQDKVDVAKFAMSYALKNCFDEVECESDVLKIESDSEADGSNYNVGTIDNDRFVFDVIRLLYPEAESPYRLVRGLMVFGLERLGELKEKNELFPLSRWM